MDVRCFTTSQWFQENCWLVRRDGAAQAILVDPGDDADRLLAAIRELEVEVAGIILTHCHIDHIGAVAPIARETGAQVWCPKLELALLRDPDSFNPWVDQIGSREGYEADHHLEGGERLELAGMSIEVLFTPGHSPGHVTFAIEDTDEGPPLLLSGDVLFQGSVGRTDLPGGDWPTLLASIRTLIERFPAEALVLPGHMGATTLGRELAANPFLDELRSPA